MTFLQQSTDNVTMARRHVTNATLQMSKTIPNIKLIFIQVVVCVIKLHQKKKRQIFIWISFHSDLTYKQFNNETDFNS